MLLLDKELSESDNTLSRTNTLCKINTKFKLFCEILHIDIVEIGEKAKSFNITTKHYMQDNFT